MTRRRPSRSQLSRRNFLRAAAGGVVALPFLESLHGEAQDSIAKRSILIYTPHCSMEPMMPRMGPDGLDFSGTYFESFQPYAQHALFVDGLEGTGGHGAGSGECFAGRPSTDGAVLPTGGPTLDVLFAERDRMNGITTRNPTLGVRAAGKNYGLDSGNGMSRDFDNRGITPVLLPEVAFDRIYAGLDVDAEEAMRRAARRASILDGITEDYVSLNARLGSRDRGLLERHLEAIRERELQLATPDTRSCTAPMRPPTSERADVRRPELNHAKMCDMAAAAILCGATNHILFENYGRDAYTDFTFLDGVTDTNYHNLNHGSADDAVEQHKIINRFFADNIAEHLIRPLAETFEVDGKSVLEHTTIVWATELGLSESAPFHHMRGDSESAKRRNIRTASLVLGGNGVLRTNTTVNTEYRHYQDFLLSLVHAMGHTDVDSFGDVGSNPIESLFA